MKPKGKKRYFYLLTTGENGYQYGYTKGEARSELKKLLRVSSLPSGTQFKEVK